MMAFIRQSIGTYKAFSWPPDYTELLLDKVINPIWFIALFHFLARYTVPDRNPFEIIIAVAVLFAGAQTALRAPEGFRAEAETHVLPNLVLSARQLPYLIAVRLIPVFIECVAVLLAAFVVGLVLYGGGISPAQSLTALLYGLLALVSLCSLGFLFAALSLLFDDYVLISNLCWSVIILFSGALFPASIYPDGWGWQLVQFAVPGNAALAGLQNTLANNPTDVSPAIYLAREAVVCVVITFIATRIFDRGVRHRLEQI